MGLLPDDEDTKNSFIHLVRSVLEKDSDIKNRFSTPIPMKVLENIALLKIAFGFNNREVASVVRGDLSDIGRTLKIPYAVLASLLLIRSNSRFISEFVKGCKAGISSCIRALKFFPVILSILTRSKERLAVLYVLTAASR